MEFNNKKLERTFIFISYVISILLCAFLIALSGKLIDDVDEWKESPTAEQFYDTNLIDGHNAKIKIISDTLALRNEKILSLTTTNKIATNNYKNAKNSFDNWLEARKTVGSPYEDKEVLSRATELDKYYKTQQDWKAELEEINDEVTSLFEEKKDIKELINKEKERANKERAKALRKYELKVFLIRLLFIFPILLLAIYFVIKFRKHKYWPLFLGFVLFAFYAFFFGLVPYLPSYGGYIRYSVGIILIVLFGIYAINHIRAFIEQKKNELKVSTTERAKKVQTETAEKALDNHMCPSCGKDFILKKWDKSADKKNKEEDYGIVTNFCRFCGLELFKKCNSCGCENFAHLPFCSNCGDPLNDEE